MSTAAYYPHISIDATGEAYIEETAYKVDHLAAEHFHYGWTAEELLRQHPELRPEQVYAALVYFYDHHKEILMKLKTSAAQAESARRAETLSRAELLQRKSNVRISQPGSPSSAALT